MATSPRTNERSSSTAHQDLRLEIRAQRRLGSVDGAWWPRSRDFQIEAADLIDHFPLVGERVQRILFSRPDWDGVVLPLGRGLRRIQAARGPVKVGSFPDDDTHQVVLTMAAGHRLTIQVVPCETTAADAQHQMQAAIA